MFENEIISYNRNRIFKYRYILIAILVLIIVLLIVIMTIVIKNTNKNKAIANNNNSNDNEEQAMLVELDNKKKEEEERAREKEEEENATGTIYLTFDDGPSSDITPQILDILDEKKVKATFFVVHFSDNNASLVKRENDSGHTVALHGYSHTYSEVYTSADSCLENFRKIQEQVYNTIGKRPNIIRFPGGSSNTISRKYCDAGHAKTKEDIYNNVTSKIKEHRENVVLMHDFSKNHKTLDALSDIIDWGMQNGYVFRKITEDTPMIRHSVNN